MFKYDIGPSKSTSDWTDKNKQLLHSRNKFSEQTQNVPECIGFSMNWYKHQKYSFRIIVSFTGAWELETDASEVQG